MARYKLICCMLLSTSLISIGCTSCSPCGDRPGWFSRFRTTSISRPVGDPNCCGDNFSGPVLPGQTYPGTTLPPSSPQQPIPRIEENGKQMPWDGKTSRPGLKSTTASTITKEGT